MLHILPMQFTGKPFVRKTGEFTAVAVGILAMTGLGVEVCLENGKPPVVTLESKPGEWYTLQDARFWIESGRPAVCIPPGFDPALPLGLIVDGPRSAWIEGMLDPEQAPIVKAIAFK